MTEVEREDENEIKVDKSRVIDTPVRMKGRKCLRMMKTSLAVSNKAYDLGYLQNHQEGHKTLTLSCSINVKHLAVAKAHSSTNKASPYKNINFCLQISEGWVSGGWGQALFSGAQ